MSWDPKKGRAEILVGYQAFKCCDRQMFRPTGWHSKRLGYTREGVCRDPGPKRVPGSRGLNIDV